MIRKAAEHKEVKVRVAKRDRERFLFMLLGKGDIGAVRF